MKIRGVRDSDVVTLVELGEAFWYSTPLSKVMPYNAQTVYDLVRHTPDSGFILVADDEGTIAGFVLVLVAPFHFNTDYKAATEIAWYVHPEYRGEGVGESLREAAEAMALTQGATFLSMMLITGTEGEAAAREQYTSQGYTKSEETFVKVL